MTLLLLVLFGIGAAGIFVVKWLLFILFWNEVGDAIDRLKGGE